MAQKRVPATQVDAGVSPGQLVQRDAFGNISSNINASGINSGTLDSARLPDTTVTPGTYVGATVTVDAKGRVTSATSNTYVTSVGVAPAVADSGLATTGTPVTSAGTITIALANDVAAIEALSGSGFSARTGTDTWALRSFVAPAAGLSITNPAGTGGNPTFALANDLAAVEGLSGTGFAVRTTADTWATRTITGTSGNILVSNGDGVSGNPTLNLVNVGTAGTYAQVTTDAFGRVISGNAQLPFASLSSTPTTLGGYGITDAVPASRTVTAAAPLVVNGVNTAVTLANNLTLAISQFTSSASGVVPASGGGTTNFLRADGTWANPGGGTVTSVAVSGSTGLAVSGSPITTSGTISLTLGTELQGLSALASNGYVLRSGAGTYTTQATIPNSGLTNSAVTLNAGGGISITGGSLSLGGSATITNTGVTSLAAGSNISVSAATGAVTVSVTGTVPNATNATNITSIDDISTNATWYPTLHTGTNVTTSLRTSSTKLSFNPSSGVLSATTFSGAHSGSGAGLTSIPNSALNNSSITVNAGTGMSGGGAVSLGGSVTLNNAGVTSLAGTANQVSVSAATGGVTLSLPQNIHTGASPTFAGLVLSGTPGTTLTGSPTSYGSLRVSGSQNGYAGIHFPDSFNSRNFMIGTGSAISGVYSVTSGAWDWYYDGGISTFRVNNANAIVLTSANFTSYSPSTTGGGASGTWSINITGSAGSAGSATNATNVSSTDDNSSNANWFPTFHTAVNGTSQLRTASSRLTFNPATGTLNATVLNATSDLAKKKNIVRIEDAMNKVNALNGVRFDWRHTEKSSAGLIAQDVEVVMPELVETTEDGKSLNYNGVVGLLVEAVKTLSQQVASLQAELDALKGK